MKKVFGIFILMILIGTVIAVEPVEPRTELFGEKAGFADDRSINLLYVEADITVDEDSKYLHIETTEDGGALDYQYGEGARSFDHLKKGAKLEFQDKELISVDITVEAPNSPDLGKGNFDKKCTEDTCEFIDYTEVEIGNRKYKLYDGSRLTYKKGEDGNPDEVRIIHPPGKELTAPEKIDDQINDEPIIRYNVNDPEGHLVLNGNKISRFDPEFDFSVYYDSELELFYSNSGARIENFNFNHLRTDKVYLVDEDFIPLGGFKGSYLKLGKKGKVEMFASKGARGYSVEFVDFEQGMRAYGGIQRSADEEGAYVWYVHGSGKDPEGNAFNEDSWIKFEPTKGVSSVPTTTATGPLDRTLVRAEGAFSHINRNRFVHSNSNIDQTGPREYYFTAKSEIDVGGGNILSRDFTKADKESRPTQIRFRDGNGNPLEVEFEVKKDGKMVKQKVKLEYDLFIDDGGRIIRPLDEDSQDLLQSTGFFDLAPKARDEAMAQLNDNRPLAEILSGMDNGKLLNAAEERAKAIEEAKRKAAEAAARDKNLPEFLQGVKIDRAIVKDLDASARDALEGNFVKSIARGESDTIAIVISSSSCGLCPGFVSGIGSPGGNVYEIKDDIPQVRQTLASKGVKIDQDTRLSYPSTVFIDTSSGTVKGFEVGSIENSKFNSYFR